MHLHAHKQIFNCSQARTHRIIYNLLVDFWIDLKISLNAVNLILASAVRRKWTYLSSGNIEFI